MEIQCQARKAEKEYRRRYYGTGDRCDKKANHVIVEGADLAGIHFVCGLHANHHEHGFVIETIDATQLDEFWYEALIPVLTAGAVLLRRAAAHYRENAQVRDRKAHEYEQIVIVLQRKLGIR